MAPKGYIVFINLFVYNTMVPIYKIVSKYKYNNQISMIWLQFQDFITINP